MSKIVVDKNELKTIRKNLDYLLENGKQSFAIETHQLMYENHDLNKKEQIIIEHLNKNPSINKEKVASGLKDDYARITILDAINGLIEKGLVIARKDKIKKRTYNLYVNYQNIISSLKRDVDAFKFFYYQLLDNVGPIIRNLLKDQKNKKRLFKVQDLLNALIWRPINICV